MYAKFRFKTDTTAATRNRMIVKAITDCYSGPASLSLDGYAGIDSARSFFYSTDSSHWTFAGEGTLASNSLNYNSADADFGAEYTLKSTYDTGHTVYCDVRLRGAHANSNVYGDNRMPSTLVVRNRVGTAIEDMQYGNTAMTNPDDADIRGMGISHRYNRDIHIMADQTKLVLAGSNQSGPDQKEICMVYQFNQTSAMKYRDKLNTIADSNVPVCAQFVTSGNGVTSADFVYRDGGAYTSTWDNSGVKAPIVMFPGNIYNERTGDKLRNIGLHGSTTMSAVNAILDDDTNARPTAAPVPNPFSQYYNSYQQFNGFFYATTWGGLSSNDIEAWDAINGNAYDIDSNGNNAIRLRPTYMDFAPIGGDEINMSEKSGIYHTVGNAGFFGDSADIGGVKYQYFPLSALNAMMIRRD